MTKTYEFESKCSCFVSTRFPVYPASSARSEHFFKRATLTPSRVVGQRPEAPTPTPQVRSLHTRKAPVMRARGCAEELITLIYFVQDSGGPIRMSRHNSWIYSCTLNLSRFRAHDCVSIPAVREYKRPSDPCTFKWSK